MQYLFLLLPLAMLFVLVRQQRNRVAAHQRFVQTLAPGDEVMTSGGILGTIRAVQDDLVELEVNPTTAIRVARSAIARKMADSSS